MQETASKKILIVDDNKLVLEIFCKAFKNKGFTCLQAYSAEQALEVLKTEIPDIIISDYSMPGLNGFEFRHKLIANQLVKDIPFIFLTSYTEKEFIVEGLDLKPADYITKDTPPDIVVTKTLNILNNLREQQERSLEELRKAATALSIKTIPNNAPQINGYYLDFIHQPYRNYPGGDFIDFIRLNNDYTVIVLGDVMGKKWGAWFYSFIFLSYIRAAVRLCTYNMNLPTSDILQNINTVVYSDPALTDILSALSMVIIDNRTGAIRYSGAGDLPLIHYKAGSNALQPISSSGLLLGLSEEGYYNELSIVMEKGDKLLIISDGLIDYRAEGVNKSDFDGFFSSLRSILPGGNFISEIKKGRFSEESSRNHTDDCSLILIEKTN